MPYGSHAVDSVHFTANHRTQFISAVIKAPVKHYKNAYFLRFSARKVSIRVQAIGREFHGAGLAPALASLTHTMSYFRSKLTNMMHSVFD